VEENGKAFSGESENAFFHGDVIFDDWVSSPLIKRIQWMGTGFGAIPFNFTLDAIKPEWKPRNLRTLSIPSWMQLNRAKEEMFHHIN
jgi:hypothetical protein